MDLITYQPKGDLKGLPIEVIKQMLIEQVAQGNKEDVKVFEKYNRAGRSSGGFYWGHTKLGFFGWSCAIKLKDFTDFYKMYMEKPYPKMMWVWNKA